MRKTNNQTTSSKRSILSDSSPLVSIIVRTKNRNTLLQNSLDSLASQSYTNLQIIIINDGGNDISELIQGYTEKLNINTIFNPQSVGRANALNSGISAADGEWLGFLDDDDIYLPDAISNLIEFSRNTAAHAVYGKVEMLDFQDKKKPKHLRFFDTAYNKDRFIFDNFIPVNSVLIKRVMIETVGKVDSDFEIFEDWDFFYRIAQSTDFHFLNTMVAEYRSYGDATAIGGKTQELHSKYRTFFYQKHFQSFTPAMLTNFYNLVLQDNQKKYLSTIDQLLKLNQTFNERNDHSLTYTKQVNDSMFVRLDQLERRINDSEVNIVQQTNLLLEQNKQIINQQIELKNALYAQINTLNEQINSLNEQRQQQISAVFEQNNQINELRQQQIEALYTQLTDIKLLLSHTFSTRLRHFAKRLFNH